jgi:DNA-binding transcriptional ArsR family regulator
LALLRSRFQADLLTWLFLHPEREFTLADLAGKIGVSQSTAHGEVERLVGAGILADRRVGRSRLVRANTESRLAAPLAQLLTLSFGPHVVVAEEFAGVNGVDLVVLYGSWAARYEGEPGREPRDVDVMVVGTPARDEVYSAADRAQERLGLEVNPTIRSRSSWEDVTDPLVAAIRAAPVVVAYDNREAVR